jgi:hypothetical protein
MFLDLLRRFFWETLFPLVPGTFSSCDGRHVTSAFLDLLCLPIARAFQKDFALTDRTTALERGRRLRDGALRIEAARASRAIGRLDQEYWSIFQGLLLLQERALGLSTSKMDAAKIRERGRRDVHCFVDPDKGG